MNSNFPRPSISPVAYSVSLSFDSEIHRLPPLMELGLGLTLTFDGFHQLSKYWPSRRFESAEDHLELSSEVP